MSTASCGKLRLGHKYLKKPFFPRPVIGVIESVCVLKSFNIFFRICSDQVIVGKDLMFHALLCMLASLSNDIFLRWLNLSSLTFSVNGITSDFIILSKTSKLLYFKHWNNPFWNNISFVNKMELCVYEKLTSIGQCIHESFSAFANSIQESATEAPQITSPLNINKIKIIFLYICFCDK